MSKMSKLWLSIILSTMTIVLVVLGVALSGMLPEVIQQGTKDCLAVAEGRHNLGVLLRSRASLAPTYDRRS